jgi:hypothetical protein
MSVEMGSISGIIMDLVQGNIVGLSCFITLVICFAVCISYASHSDFKMNSTKLISNGNSCDASPHCVSLCLLRAKQIFVILGLCD